METEELEISLAEIFAALWHRGWVIIVCMVIGAGIGFGVSNYLIDPTYSSKVSMYVNNNTNRTDAALNINDINASQKLVATYIEILKSEKVLNKVIEQMESSYTTQQLRKMISASSLNNTEILEVTVTTRDPEEAAAIANSLAEIAPKEIIRVVQAGDVQLIDEAVPNEEPVAPSVLKYTLMMAVLGAALAVLAILVLHMLDISIKSVEDLQKRYDLPVLGSIPDLLEVSQGQK